LNSLQVFKCCYITDLCCPVTWFDVSCTITEILESVPPEANKVQYVIYVLASEEIDGLPPGGGIHAKLAIADYI
jgi:Protein serine/threonine phosphatase 2C, C-terminal domain